MDFNTATFKELWSIKSIGRNRAWNLKTQQPINSFDQLKGIVPNSCIEEVKKVCIITHSSNQTKRIFSNDLFLSPVASKLPPESTSPIKSEISMPTSTATTTTTTTTTTTPPPPTTTTTITTTLQTNATPSLQFATYKNEVLGLLLKKLRDMVRYNDRTAGVPIGKSNIDLLPSSFTYLESILPTDVQAAVVKKRHKTTYKFMPQVFDDWLGGFAAYPVTRRGKWHLLRNK